MNETGIADREVPVEQRRRQELHEQLLRQVGRVGADHHQFAVRHVDHAHQPEDDRQAQRHQHQHRALRQAAEHVADAARHVLPALDRAQRRVAGRGQRLVRLASRRSRGSPARAREEPSCAEPTTAARRASPAGVAGCWPPLESASSLSSWLSTSAVADARLVSVAARARSAARLAALGLSPALITAARRRCGIGIAEVQHGHRARAPSVRSLAGAEWSARQVALGDDGRAGERLPRQRIERGAPLAALAIIDEDGDQDQAALPGVDVAADVVA